MSLIFLILSIQLIVVVGEAPGFPKTLDRVLSSVELLFHVGHMSLDPGIPVCQVIHLGFKIVHFSLDSGWGLLQDRFGLGSSLENPGRGLGRDLSDDGFQIIWNCLLQELEVIHCCLVVANCPGVVSHFQFFFKFSVGALADNPLEIGVYSSFPGFLNEGHPGSLWIS